jgi:hypothetical protein
VYLRSRQVFPRAEFAFHRPCTARLFAASMLLDLVGTAGVATVVGRRKETAGTNRLATCLHTVD